MQIKRLCYIGAKPFLSGVHFMANWRRILFGSICLLFLSTLQSAAHRPGFERVEKTTVPGFGAVEFAVLYGDGIVFANPLQVVVMDQEGYLLAATPISMSLSIQCSKPETGPTCFVYDEVAKQVFEPAYDQWVRGRRIKEEHGGPAIDAYPEEMDIAYGFTQRAGTSSEALSSHAREFMRSPLPTIVSILWWCAAWLLLARSLWRWKRNGWRLWPIRPFAVLRLVMGIVILSVMFVLATLFTDPSAAEYLLFVFLTGTILSFILARPGRVPLRDPMSVI